VRITQSRGSIPRAVATASLLSVFGCSLLMAQSGPVGAFDKIKALSGEWVTKTPDGMSMTSSFRVTAAGSAVMQMLGEGTEHEMPTIYHMDGDRLMVTHYCAAKNQPRMVLDPGQGSGGRLQFEFLDATNLKSPEDGHMRRLALTFIDKDHIRQEWTYRDKGKESTEAFDLVRKR
jgi:hypothetical protein